MVSSAFSSVDSVTARHRETNCEPTGQRQVGRPYSASARHGRTPRRAVRPPHGLMDVLTWAGLVGPITPPSPASCAYPRKPPSRRHCGRDLCVRGALRSRGDKGRRSTEEIVVATTADAPACRRRDQFNLGTAEAARLAAALCTPAHRCSLESPAHRASAGARLLSSRHRRAHPRGRRQEMMSS